MVDASPRPAGWVRRFHPAPDAPTRLLCFPHAGGSATFFFPVSRTLTPRIEVLAIQYPGRQDRRHEPFVDDIHQLAELVVAELDGALDKPVTLLGHSMGATIAFEVALLLQRRGVPLLGLFASGRRAPSCHRDERVHQADDAAVVAELSRVGGTYGDMLHDEEVLRMILPAVRNDYRAAETYRYRPGESLTCPVVALTGDRDPYVDLTEAQAWERHTTGPFDLRVYPGAHFFLADHVPAVLDLVAAHVDRQLLTCHE
ncbi:thioesterase II family protein [Catellatospora tritici]|uniref:thioesterase II family protein n=1 Tax=Catellatospora tritici TaxID=2851566 RepID=UPI001C2D3784|nr:alpha/beta fold hydrolase [Catellatospora tritici]MBV1855114.1 alpha/beta fold hydrolase [Catellatospora tritici]